MEKTARRLYLVDIIENCIVDAVFNGILSNRRLVHADDLSFYDKWIPGELFENFQIDTIELIRTMPENDRESFLRKSLQQFKTHTPEMRIDAFYDKYWYNINPDEPDWIINLTHKRKVNPVLKAYKKHFSKFEEYTAQLHLDYIDSSLLKTSISRLPSNCESLIECLFKPNKYFSIST